MKTYKLKKKKLQIFDFLRKITIIFFNILKTKLTFSRKACNFFQIYIYNFKFFIKNINILKYEKKLKING